MNFLFKSMLFCLGINNTKYIAAPEVRYLKQMLHSGLQTLLNCHTSQSDAQFAAKLAEKWLEDGQQWYICQNYNQAVLSYDNAKKLFEIGLMKSNALQAAQLAAEAHLKEAIFFDSQNVDLQNIKANLFKSVGQRFLKLFLCQSKNLNFRKDMGKKAALAFEKSVKYFESSDSYQALLETEQSLNNVCMLLNKLD